MAFRHAGNAAAAAAFGEFFVMKSRESLVRLKGFQLNEKRRQLQQIQTMMGEMERMCAELEQQIMNEEKKAGITDVTHFAYPTFAKAARKRADNLNGSIRELKVQQDAAELAVEEADAEYQKAAALEERDASQRLGRAG
jgi:hypothetical protein